MAIKVPVADIGRVQQQGLPGARQQVSYQSRRAGDFIGANTVQALDTVNDVAGQAQNTALQLYRQEVDDANRLRIQDAANQLEAYDQDAAFSETGWRNQRGADVFSQQNSKPLPDNVLENRQKKIDELMNDLGNEYQRSLFQQHAQTTSVNLRGQLIGHEAEQHRVYKRGVLASGIDTATRSMALYYNDENKLNESIALIDQASKDLGHLEHGSVELGASSGKQHISSALSQAIDASLAQGDHASATRILQKFSPHMDSNDMLKAYKLITGEQERRQAIDVSRQVISEVYPRMETSEHDRAFNILLQAESGGVQFKNGQTITSPKGAVGIAQVMPDTGPEAAKLAGLPWDENRYRNDPEYNKALGKAYFSQQLTAFNGNLSLAYAAYNAGPGATKVALDQYGNDWLLHLPAETQAYVSKNMKAFSAGQGQNPKPTLEEAQQTALAKLGDTASPTLQKETLDLVEKQFNLQNKAIKQRQEEATAEAMRTVLANGGKWDDLPATLRGQVPVEDVDKVMNFSKKVSEGEPIQTDWGLWYQLKNDPQLLKTTNLMSMRDKLNDSEFKHLTEEQQTLLNQGESSLTQLRTPKQILDQFMVEAGIDPTPTNDKGAATVGKIWNTFETRVRDAELDKGKKLTMDEIRTVAAQMFTQVGVKGMLWGTNEKPAVMLDKTDQIQVPDDERKLIIIGLRETYPGKTITENDILEQYIIEHHVQQ
jgi:soluble lytic murein transglycosylase